MIHNIEDKTRKELVEIVKIQMEEYQALLKRAEAAERERERLPNEQGCNRYGLDMAYFRNAINRELNRPLVDYKPDELARVLARLSRTADKSVMFEPEFSNKFAIEQQIKGIYEATNYVADNNDISYLPNDFILELCEKYAEQLRQQINGGE